MPDQGPSQTTVRFAPQPAAGGGYELGGNYTEAEAAAVQLHKSDSKVMRIIRRTIFREPSGLDEMSTLTST